MNNSKQLKYISFAAVLIFLASLIWNIKGHSNEEIVNYYPEQEKIIIQNKRNTTKVNKTNKVGKVVEEEIYTEAESRKHTKDMVFFTIKYKDQESVLEALDQAIETNNHEYEKQLRKFIKYRYPDYEL